MYNILYYRQVVILNAGSLKCSNTDNLQNMTNECNKKSQMEHTDLLKKFYSSSFIKLPAIW